MTQHRSGTVGLYGRPNTGKSTLFNRLLGQKLAIVSPREQTTRHLLNGILTTPEYQMVLVDSPGFQTRHRGPLNRALNRRAGETARDTDIIAWVVEALRLEAADREALAHIPEGRTIVAVVNKIDRVRPASRLLPFIEKLAAERPFAAIVPVSATTGRNLDALLRVLQGLLPPGPALYGADQITDRDERFFAGELLREKLFRLLGAELPYQCEVRIESFQDKGGLRHIEAVIWVERDSHKPIILGSGGTRLKRMATEARKDMERLFDGRVFLRVWVKVKRGWSENQVALRELGYG